MFRVREIEYSSLIFLECGNVCFPPLVVGSTRDVAKRLFQGGRAAKIFN